jgi:hypothetical protein
MTRIHSVVPRDPATFTTSLPYSFDTCTLWGKVLKGGIVLTLFLGACVLAALLVGHFLAALQLAICCVLLLVAVRKAGTLEGGSAGTITRDSVEVHRGTLFGRALPGPAGTYPIAQFKAVQVKLVTPSPLQHTPGATPSLSIYLVGAGATPTIFVASEDRDSEVGEELAMLLNLPCESDR